MHWKIARDLEKMEKPIFAESELEPTPRGEDTIRTLKHVKDRAANLAERPQRVSSVTRITSTLRVCANARTFLDPQKRAFSCGKVLVLQTVLQQGPICHIENC
jgi:hypothetical protein